MEQSAIYITLGRWTGPSSPQQVPNLNEDTLKEAILKHLAGIQDYRNMATQVLVWADAGRLHNLVAVFDLYTKTLKTL